MKIQTFVLVLLITGISFAQSSINYKALIKDVNGNVIANQIIDVKLTVIAATGSTDIYQETHTAVATDANGIAIVHIGEGVPDLNAFTDIDWGSDEHLLKVEMDIEQDASFVDMGTIQFMAVPYALNAANVSGIEKVTENSNTGHRIIGRTVANYGDIGIDAVDISLSANTSTTRGATGAESVAMGYNTTASGERSTAMGDGTVASGSNSTTMGNLTYAPGNNSTAMGEVTQALGDRSTAMGFQTIASGRFSTAMGSFTTASGRYSTAMGYGTDAPSHGETVIGTFNEKYTPIDSVAFNANDRLFVIGNGANVVAESNALTVLKNGTITAPSFDLSEIIDDKALVTKEYVDVKASGLEEITENDNGTNKTGWRLSGMNPFNYGYIGSEAIDLSINFSSSIANGALGDISFAAGYETRAWGTYSTAFGEGTSAYGSSSTSMGRATTASGSSSTAMGLFTEADGDSSTAMGRYTKAPSFGETAIGIYSLDYTPVSTQNYNENDRLFVIGNGMSVTQRMNALTVLKSGNIGVVTDTPRAKLHISQGNDTGLGNNNGFLLLGETDSENISIDNNEIMAKDNGNPADLNLQIEGGNVLVGGEIQVNQAVNSGIAMRVNGDEAVWYNGTFFSWGFGGQANHFEDDTGIGTSAPQTKLHVVGTNDTGLGNNHGYFLLGHVNGSNISMDNNEIMARNNGNIADLNLQVEGGNVKIGGPLYIGDEVIQDAGNNALRINAALLPDVDNTNVLGNPSQRWTTVYATNGTINTSDRREKKNIKELNYGLSEVLQMQPVSFNWKNQNNPDIKLGLIAQDLQELIPELVKSHTWETDEVTGQLTKKELERLGVYYSDVVPVLIKAIQEQNKIIESQSNELKASNKNYKSLLSRVEQLESNSSN